jgi:hypothetical protein
MLLFGICLEEVPALYRYCSLTTGDDMTSAKQWQEREVVPEAVGFSFHDAVQTLVAPVVPYLGVLAPAGRTLLSLIEPGPEVGCHMPTLRALQVILVLYLDS